MYQTDHQFIPLVTCFFLAIVSNRCIHVAHSTHLTYYTGYVEISVNDTQQWSIYLAEGANIVPRLYPKVEKSKQEPPWLHALHLVPCHPHHAAITAFKQFRFVVHISIYFIQNESDGWIQKNTPTKRQLRHTVCMHACAMWVAGCVVWCGVVRGAGIGYGRLNLYVFDEETTLTHNIPNVSGIARYVWSIYFES